MLSAQRNEVHDPLNGRYCRIWPYLRGHYPRSLLGELWQLVESEGASRDIFYGSRAEPKTTPIDTCGDLTDFVEYFRANRPLYLVADNEDRVVGFFWLDEMVQGQRATISLFFRKDSRGRLAFEAGRIFRDYCISFLGFKEIWGVTPWKQSVAMGRWLGMKTVAVLPQFQRIDGKLFDLYLLRYKAANG